MCECFVRNDFVTGMPFWFVLWLVMKIRKPAAKFFQVSGYSF